MKRYLITFLDTDGQFQIEAVMATNVSAAITVFMDHNIAHDEITAVNLCR